MKERNICLWKRHKKQKHDYEKKDKNACMNGFYKKGLL